MSLAHLLFVVAGPVLGAFIGRAAVAQAAGAPWRAAAARCGSCGHALDARERIPIAGWFWARGRCRACDAPAPRTWLACELAGLSVPIWAWIAPAAQGSLLLFALTCLFGWTLIGLAAVDALTRILPNVLNLTAAALGVAMVALTRPAFWADHLAGAVVGYVALVAVELAYRRLRGRDGLGRGDAKLLGALGLWTGWRGLPLILLVGSLTALAFVLAASRLGRRPLDGQSAIAFGPWLAFAGWVVWLYGPAML